MHVAPDSATVPLWLDEPEQAPRRAPLPGPAAVDVCVIGAGIGGLATAWHLADRGVLATVVEARHVAAGASGRNGGFFLAGLAPMYDVARDLWGDAARARYAATLAAQLEMLAVAETVGAREHFDVAGLLRLGVDAGEAEAVRRHHAALRADGLPGELVAEGELPAALRRPGRLALRTAHDGTVHPVRWLRALAAALERRGVPIHEDTRVTAPPAPTTGAVAVNTARGTIRARRAVVAVDALAALVPSAAHVRARRLNMLATAPAPRGLLPQPVYARDGHEYAQQRPDGRIALGGFSDVDGAASWTDREEVSAAAQACLDRWLHDELGLDVEVTHRWAARPVRAAGPGGGHGLDVEVTHRWAGVVGYAEDPVPTCGPVPGTDQRVHALGGYNGTGHVQAWVAAREVARALTGTLEW